MIRLVILSAALLSATWAQPVDRIVDASGATGPYLDINAAMLASNPGDRILVSPGHYPAFQCSVGVEIIGTGSTPGDVVVERIAFHPSIPARDFNATIAKLTVRSTRAVDVLSIHGNELAPGVLTIDGCIIENGIFLRGGQQGFYVLINNSKITPPAGHGFSGEACWLGGPGNFVELRNTRILGWDADSRAQAPAGTALRLAGGSSVRIDGCEVFGGSGVAGSALLQGGATAIASIGPGSVQLSLDGATVVHGGAGTLGPGGHGVDVVGTIEVGTADVQAGFGTPTGSAYARSTPSVAPSGRHLSLSPRLVFANGAVALRPGQHVAVELNVPHSVALIGFALDVDLPAGSDFIPLPLIQTWLRFDRSTSFTIPFIPGASGPGPTFYAQGFAIDPQTSIPVLSNVAAVRIEF